MGAFRLGLLGGLATLLIALLLPALRVDPQHTIEYTNPRDLWTFVCEVNADPCSDLRAPELRVERMYADLGYLGGFRLDQPEGISLDLAAIETLYGSRVKLDSVIVHEMQHYYDFWRGNIALPYASTESRCAVEGAGFDTQAVYLLANDAPELVDSEWRIRYGC